MTLRKKIYRELGHMVVVVALLAGLGIYASDFVIHGVMAKPELNGLIIATAIFATALSFMALNNLFNDMNALDALNTDYGYRRKTSDSDIYSTPAKVFKRPSLLGYGYRLITEELQNRGQTRLPAETVHLLVKDVDQRISDMRSTLTYFGGLLVFLGLLGAFMGLMKTVHSVGDLIGSMDMSGAGGADSIGKMIDGMKGPLAGMSTGFSSSLFGLMFSMVIGLIDRFLISAMKAVRNEFEATLINMAELETAHASGAAPGHAPHHGASQAAGHGVGGAGAGLSPQAEEAFARIREASERTQEQLHELNATVAGAFASLRSQKLRATIDDTLSLALAAIADGQRQMSEQMGRFADAALQMAEDRSDSDARLLAAQERQSDLIAEFLARPAGGGSPSLGAHAGGPVQIGSATGPESQGARALLDRLAQAFRQSRALQEHAGAGRVANAQLERSMIATQALARETMKRLDDMRRDDRRVVRDISRRQEAVLRQLSDVSQSIARALNANDITPRDRIEAMRAELENMQRAAANDLKRLESHVVASRRMAERAELAAKQTAQNVETMQATLPARGRQSG
jgi:hypothetical protein